MGCMLAARPALFGIQMNSQTSLYFMGYSCILLKYQILQSK